MCGIAGVLGPGATEAAAQALVAPLVHRGPNGIRVESLDGAALAHARLSIIDLEGGWQPLHAAGSTIVANGEVYNWPELTAEFGLADTLATGSDFEPLLHLYALEGPRAFQRLRGMYAFCLVGCDGRDWLVRDPFGIKPLYVREAADGVAFASELRSLRPADARLDASDEAGVLLATGASGAAGGSAAEQLLALNYLVDDRRLGVERVPPGAVWRVEAGRVVERGALHAIPAPAIHARAPEAALLDRLDAVLEDSVRVHQRSDVPYGLFLSGGVDSTAIAVLMARLNARPVTAFTCGFDAPGASDERRAAERTARALDLDWRETSFGAEDFRRIAPLAAAALDDPTTDYACLPTYRLAEAARGVLTVVLAGEGGDELFGGYGRYRRALRPAWLGGRPAEPRPEGWLNWLHIDPASRLLHRISGAAARAPVEAWRAATARRPPPPGPLTALQRAQWSDIAGWLPDDLLLKLDRMLMAHGMEGRTPFLDREVAQFAWNLPDREKVRGRWGKWLLRRWLARACPSAQPWTRKRGFTTPVAAWIASDATATADRLVAAGWLEGVLHPDRLRLVFADVELESRRWPLLFLGLWIAVHQRGLTPDEARIAAFG